MPTFTIKNVTFGDGIPKLCVPLTASGRDDLLRQAAALAASPCDVVEWRADLYAGCTSLSETKETLRQLRQLLAHKLLLFTFRSMRDGGTTPFSVSDYTTLNREVIRSGLLDLVDIELSAGEALVNNLLFTAHAAGIKVVLSSHNFTATPSKEQMVTTLRHMQVMGGDMPKLAVMPHSKEDVLQLLAATLEMTSRYADRPIVTMSMGAMGTLSRLTGEYFGSAMTFASYEQASAPGQLALSRLSPLMKELHTIFATDDQMEESN